ncbi:beta-lactamase-like protein, partial [Globomyces pollinis-pini]
MVKASDYESGDSRTSYKNLVARCRSICNHSVMSIIAKASTAKADIYLEHGNVVNVGSIGLKAIATPGHTAGCMSFYLEQQKLVFTGDAVLIRGCGRTDFQGGDA